MKKFFKGLGSGLLYFGIYLVAQLAVSFAAAILFVFIAIANVGIEAYLTDMSAMETVINMAMDMTFEYAMLISVVSNIFTVLVLWIIFVCRKRKFCKEVGYKAMKPAFVPIIALAGCALNVLVALVMSYLPIPEEVMSSYAEQASMLDEGNPAIAFIAGGIIAPFVEEIVFRGLIFDRFKKGMPVWIAAVLSSLLFGAMHGHIVWASYAFVLGLLLCWFFCATKSLWGCTILHLAFNTFNYALNAMLGDTVTTFGFDMILLGVSLVVTVVTVCLTAKIKNKEKATALADQE